MRSSFRTTITAAIGAMALAGSLSTVEALPMSGVAVPAQTAATPMVDNVYYRCGYYRCHYRHYGYGYYRPYYRPYGYYYRPRLFGVF